MSNIIYYSINTIILCAITLVFGLINPKFVFFWRKAPRRLSVLILTIGISIACATIIFINTENESENRLQKIAAEQCPKFIEKNLNYQKTLEIRMFDSYTKNNKFVSEVGFREKDSDESYSIRLCILDSEKGSIFSPSVFEQGDWRR